jgi:dephospho-CoA kinase
VLTVAITGGIGSGKSALADLLVARGALLIDADQIARDVVEPGQPALAKLVKAFGGAILKPDGSLDRQQLADVAFADAEHVAKLNAIVHPAISEELLARREAVRASEGVALFAIPLLTAGHRDVLDLDLVVVVDCPIDVAIERLVEQRGFSRADATARVASQLSREERAELADLVVENDGDLDSLEHKADELWSTLHQRVSGGG